VERSLRKFFGKRGESVVQENLRAVRRGFQEVIEVNREEPALAGMGGGRGEAIRP
jgi:pyruvate-ferredoxin/flavodoxin oxidoreductase